MPQEKKLFVIGVDGGGTKTVAALADFKGRILKTGEAGPSSPRNVGTTKTAENVARAIKKVLAGRKDGTVLSLFVGLPAVAEEYKTKKEEIKRKILKEKGIPRFAQNRAVIGSDQIVAFRAGTKEKNGILLIAGTGSACHGWRGKKEVHVSGWGWLADEGSGFWLGQKALQAVFKDLDGRGKKTLLTRTVFKKWGLAEREELQKRVYNQDYIETVSSLAALVGAAGRKKDKIAGELLSEAGVELSLVAKTAIRKLGFSRAAFPLVLSGGVFKSEIIAGIFKKEIKKVAPKAEIILLKEVPVKGAVDLAIEHGND